MRLNGSYSLSSFFLSRKIRFLILTQKLSTIKGNAHSFCHLALRQAMGFILVLFCAVFMEYIEILYKKGDLEGVRRWLQAVAETGDQKAVSN